MDEKEIKKELEKYESVREKVLRLNEIIKCIRIYYGLDYIRIVWNSRKSIFYHGSSAFRGGCLFCGNSEVNNDSETISLQVKNKNIITYYRCYSCENKNLCAYCLHEKENCNLTTKKKITFYLSSQKTFPKDIRRLITNLFFKLKY